MKMKKFKSRLPSIALAGAIQLATAIFGAAIVGMDPRFTILAALAYTAGYSFACYEV
jgi:hypothetical protein